MAQSAAFHIPADYQERILEAHRKLESAYSDVERERTNLERQPTRSKELYEWGDYTRKEYQTRRDSIVRQLEALTPYASGPEPLARLAQFLADVPAAWEAATPEQQNKLARCLFDDEWLKDKDVIAVKPGPELEPFFRLNHEELVKQNNIEGVMPRRVELYHEHGLGVIIIAPLDTGFSRLHHLSVQVSKLVSVPHQTR